MVPRRRSSGPTGDRDGGGLTRWQALPLAVGSVAGSGILFLPSAVYRAAGRDSVVVWLAATALCLPMLLLFEDVVRTAPPGRGMQWLISAGLGRPLGSCVPVLFVAVVVLGLPGGAVVAGAYARRALGGGPVVTAVVAAGVLAVAVAANLAGRSAGARLQTGATWLLVVVVTALVVPALVVGARGSSGTASVGDVLPDGLHVGVVLPAVVLAFWAFAGFENLTFLSADLRHPGRDLLPVSAAALALYGGLTIALTAAIAVTVPRSRTDALTGLLQLTTRLPHQRAVVTAVLLTAVTAMVLNAVAWTRGVSRLVAHAAADHLLPAALARSGPSGAPARAVGLLAVLFTATATVLAARPQLVPLAISAAGSVFLVLYTLCIVAYLRWRGLTVRSVLNLLPLVAIVPTLAGAGWQSLYAPAVAMLFLTGQVVAPRLRGARRCDDR